MSAARPKRVARVVAAIPELGARPGDLLTINDGRVLLAREVGDAGALDTYAGRLRFIPPPGATVVGNLAPIGVTPPATESQVRPLTALPPYHLSAILAPLSATGRGVLA